MTTMVVTFPEWTRWLKRLGKRYMPAVQRGLLSGAARSLVLLQNRTRDARPANPMRKGEGGAVNTGQYLRSWRTERVPGGVRVWNSAPYAPIVEFGRRKGAKMPPVAEMEIWARRRLELSATEAKRAAFVIARAIARRGLEGRRIMTGARTVMTRYIEQEVQRELEKELKAK